MDKTPKRLLRVINTEEKCRKAIEVYYWWSSKYWNDPNKRNEIFAANIIPRCPYHNEVEGHNYNETDSNEGINRKFKQYRCKIDRKSFNVITNTIFYCSRISLQKWFEAFWYYKREAWRKNTKGIANKLNVDKRTVEQIFAKFDSLPKGEQNLLYDIKNKYKTFQEVIIRKKIEREEYIESDSELKNLKKKKNREKGLSNKKIYEEFCDDLTSEQIKDLIRFKKDMEKFRKKDKSKI